MQQRLPPLPLRDIYFLPVRAEIQRVFNEMIFVPLQRAIKDPNKAVQNSKDALEAAIRAGRIWLEGDKVKGSFDAQTSKALRSLGATFSSSRKEWTIEPTSIPTNVRMAQADASMKFDATRQRILFAMDTLAIPGVEVSQVIAGKYQTTLNRMEADFQKSIKNKIAIAPQLTDAARDMIAKDWADNLTLYIQKWVAEDILELRQKVMANAFQGFRAEALEEMIIQNYGVSRRKAEFLARQETSLLMSKFRETRYKDIGATRYIWRGAMDERERPDHKKLQGKTFAWDQPPVVDLETGRRCNPGEDYGCRCVAIAVVE